MAIQDIRSRFQKIFQKTHLSDFDFFFHSQFFLIYESLKRVPLNLVFIVHLVPTTWGVQGSWSSNSYLFYNSFFLLMLLWCIHNKESEEAVILTLVVDVFAILFDVVVLSLNFPVIPYRYDASYFHSGMRSGEIFSAAMAILNSILRLFSCAILHKQWRDRMDISAGFNPNDNKQLSKPDVKLMQIEDVVSSSGDFNPSSNI